MTETRKKPVYYGMRKYMAIEDGYSVWLPSDWYQFDMGNGHKGWVFSPYKDNINTCFTCEKKILDYKVLPEDLDILKEGFEAGIKSLQDV